MGTHTSTSFQIKSKEYFTLSFELKRCDCDSAYTRTSFMKMACLVRVPRFGQSAADM